MSRPKLNMLCAVLLLINGAGGGAMAPAQPRDMSTAPLAEPSPAPDFRQQIMAAFIFKFGNFIDWPPLTFSRPQQPLVIAVAGAEEIAGYLRSIAAGTRIRGHPVEIRSVNDDEPVRAHILFIGHGDSASVAALISRAQGRPVVTVTDDMRAGRAAGIINFVNDDDRVRFDIDLEAAQQARLRVSARLLRVARAVYGEER